MAQAQEVYLFQPTQIAGCILWLDAADSTVFNGSSWTDKSGTANNAVNPNPGTTNMPSVTTWTNNRQAARFSIANNNAIRTTNNIPATSVTYFMVLRIRAVSGYSIFFLNNVDGQRQMNVNTSSFPANINVTYNSSLAVAVPLSVTQNQPFLLCSTADTSTLSLFANGAITASATQNPINTSSASQNFFGAGNSPGPYTDCDFAEILIYNTVFSTTNRQQIEGYLAWKWNLQDSLPSNHPFKNNPPYTQSNFPLINPPRPPLQAVSTQAFLPTQISNCVLWLDGADRSTISLSGNNLTGWADKSGLGNSVNSISSTPPTYSASGTGIAFSSPNTTFARGPLNTTYNSNATTFVVGIMQSNINANAFPRVFVIGQSGGSDTALISQLNLFTQGTPSGILTYLGNGQSPTPYGTNVQTLVPLGYDSRYMYTNVSTYNTATTAFTNDTFMNGNTSTYSAISGTGATNSFYVSTYNKYSLGNYLNTNAVAGDCMNGIVSEVLVYSRNLSTTDRQQIEGYLAWKWGLVASLPSNHPFRNVPFNPFPYPLVPTVAISNTNRFWQPTQYSGCHLWLDAADTNTLTINGINVSQWRDKSTNAFVFNGSSGTFPTYTSTLNGLPVISTATGQKLTTTSWSQNFSTPTVFFLIRPTQNITVNGQSYIILKAVTGTGTINLDVSYSNQVNYYYYLQVWSTNSFMIQATLNNSSSFNPTNLPLLLSGIINGLANQNIGRYNATNLSTVLNNASTYVTLSGVTLDILGTSDGRGFDTCEVIVYNRVLTFREYTQVEGYLAWKWGVQANLPSNHPFRLFPPSP